MNIKDFKESLDYIFAAQTTAFVWGHAGIGKSSIVKQYAKDKGYHFFPLYLGTQCDLGDILGLADFKRDKAGNPIATTFSPPIWLTDTITYCENNPKSGAIIFLDEFNRARRDILNGMFSLALDKTFHTITLPSNCHIIAAGNPPTDEYVVTDVNETALMARFVHIKLEPTFDEWVSYSKAKEMDPTLVSFLQEQPQLLEETRSTFDLPVKVDRRAYEKLNRFFALKTPQNLLDQLMMGIIGIERTVAYQAHLKNSEKPLSAVDALTSDGIKTIKKWAKPEDMKASLLSITADNVAAFMTDLDVQTRTLTSGEAKNMYAFLTTLPKDMFFVISTKLVEASNKAFKAFFTDEKYAADLTKLIREARGFVDAESADAVNNK